MNRVRKALDRWLGRGEASITTPPMDGAFRPNDLLDAAASVLEAPAPDDLAMTRLGLVVSSGRSLLRVNATGDAPAASFDADISALAGLPDGGAAVGLVDGRIVFVGGRYDGKTIAARTDVRCITALAAAADGALLVANGSATSRACRLEARPHGERRLRVGVAVGAGERRMDANCGKSGLPERSSR